MASKRPNLRLSESLRSRLESLVRATGRSESELAREAIEEYLPRSAKLPACDDLAEQAGLIGCISSDVGDLSTNPEHVEGFGR